MNEKNDINIMVLLLCGLPASGKTTLANELINFRERKLVNKNNKYFLDLIFIKISYDDVLKYAEDPSMLSDSTNKLLDINCWKSHRIEVLSFLSDFICNLKTMSDADIITQLMKIKCKQNTISAIVQEIISYQISHNRYNKIIFILDDNFYYESMRYSVFQICKKYKISFGQIYMLIDEKESILRNSNRIKKVSDKSMSDIIEKFEKPDALKNNWEIHSICVQSSGKIQDYSWCNIFSFFEKCLNSPESINPELVENSEKKKASLEISLTNILHQSDIILRKCVSNKIKEYQGENKKIFAIKVNHLRENILQEIRNGKTTITNLPLMDVANVDFINEINELFTNAYKFL